MRLARCGVFMLVAGCLSVAQVDPIDPLDPVQPDRPWADPVLEPEPEDLIDDPIVDLSVAGQSFCVVRASGLMQCWGDGALTKIMSGTPVDHGDPQDVASIDGLFEQACMLHDDGGVSCWGWDHHLQFGGALERGDETAVPLRLPHVADAVQLASGHHHLCVRTIADELACWGEPYSRSLGPDLYRSEAPSVIALPDDRIVDISAAIEQVCAVGDSGRAWCWGQLGLRNGPLSDQSGDPIDLSIDADLTRIHAGYQGGCAWDAEGQAWCWGSPWAAETPFRPDWPAVAEVRVAWRQACALGAEAGRVWCTDPVPDEVSTEVGFTHLATSDQLACAAHRDGRVACWDADGVRWESVD